MIALQIRKLGQVEIVELAVDLLRLIRVKIVLIIALEILGRAIVLVSLALRPGRLLKVFQLVSMFPE
jgi:hypothetical protein